MSSGALGRVQMQPMQGRQSGSSASMRWKSTETAPTKKVICMTKSMDTAMAATAQNCCSAGMLVEAPMAKARASAVAAAVIVGPTSASTSPMSRSTGTKPLAEDGMGVGGSGPVTVMGVSDSYRGRDVERTRSPLTAPAGLAELFSLMAVAMRRARMRSAVLVMMNMLSTPMARMRKGTTSVTIMVMLPPPKPHAPMAPQTETTTTKMPPSPSSARDRTGWGNLPIATTM
mmetsp:Transcript_26891/g.100995  ORF Transcript_26891/g.100995 Transcript_26891/m.100995 type:complete len:230 (+) Transcript_26891:1133-1822(+)